MDPSTALRVRSIARVAHETHLWVACYFTLPKNTTNSNQNAPVHWLIKAMAHRGTTICTSTGKKRWFPAFAGMTEVAREARRSGLPLPASESPSMLISEYENTQNEPISPRTEKAVRQKRLTARRSSFGLLAHRLGTLVEHVVHQVDQIGNLATPLRLPRSPLEATCGRRPRNDDCCVFQQPAKLPSLARPRSNPAACAPGNAARQTLRSDSGHSPVRPGR